MKAIVKVFSTVKSFDVVEFAAKILWKTLRWNVLINLRDVPNMKVQLYKHTHSRILVLVYMTIKSSRCFCSSVLLNITTIVLI